MQIPFNFTYRASPAACRFTETDLRLFPTLARFDAVYATLFKCSRKRVGQYPNLQAWLRDVYQLPLLSASSGVSAAGSLREQLLVRDCIVCVFEGKKGVCQSHVRSCFQRRKATGRQCLSAFMRSASVLLSDMLSLLVGR